MKLLKSKILAFLSILILILFSVPSSHGVRDGWAPFYQWQKKDGQRFVNTDLEGGEVRSLDGLMPFAAEGRFLWFGHPKSVQPMYTGRSYDFQVYLSGRNSKTGTTSADSANPETSNVIPKVKFRVKVYQKSDDFAAGSMPIYTEILSIPQHFTTESGIKGMTVPSIPFPIQPEWFSWVQEGGEWYLKGRLHDEYGLDMKVSYMFGDDLDFDLRVSNKCRTEQFFFVVEWARCYFNILTGKWDYVSASGESGKIASEEFYPLYGLSFVDGTPVGVQRATMRRNCRESNAPLPAEYDSSMGVNASLPTTIDPKQFLALVGESVDESLLARNPAKELVARLGRDPLAIAAYVQNEINLEDVTSSTYRLRIYRSPTATLLQKVGTPWEQCALLVSLLREAGHAAAFATLVPNEKSCGILLPKCFGISSTSILGEDAAYSMNSFPQVVYWDCNAKKWISLFPWLKDMEVLEGPDAFSYFPQEYGNATKWVKAYLQNDPSLLKYIGANGNDTVVPLFEGHLKERLVGTGLSVSEVGRRKRVRKHQYNTWEDFPRPGLSGELKVERTLENHADLFTTAQVSIESIQNPCKRLDLPETRLANIYNRASYVYFEPLTAAANEMKHNLCLAMNAVENGDGSIGDFRGSLAGHQCIRLLTDQSDKDFRIRVALKGLSTDKKDDCVSEFVIERGVFASICVAIGLVNMAMPQIHAEEFNKLKDHSEVEALGELTYAAGFSFFEKCSRSQQKLQQWMNTTGDPLINIGLSKLSPANQKPGNGNLNDQGDFIGKPQLIYPQVDMHEIGVYQSLYSDTKTRDIFRSNFHTMTIADYSSNEHQVINDFYNDHKAISTVKLLQLTNKRGRGMVLLDPVTLALNKDEFSQGVNGQLDSVAKLFQWDRKQKKWADSFKLNPDWLNSFAFATPGMIESDDQAEHGVASYKGMGTLIFSLKELTAYISSNQFLMHGGYGTKLPADVATNLSSLTINTSSQGGAVEGLRDTHPVRKTQTKQNTVLIPEGYSGALGPTEESVDLATGAFSQKEIEGLLEGFPKFMLIRRYNSRYPIAGDFGFGWQRNRIDYLYFPEMAKTYLHACELDGTVVVYRQVGDRWLVHSEDNPGVTFNEEGKPAAYNSWVEMNGDDYLLHDGDGTIRVYKPLQSGGTPRLIEWKDNFNHRLEFEYNDDKLVRIKNNSGNCLLIKYNSNETISEVETPSGHYSYEYDDLGDLVRVNLPEGILEYTHAKYTHANTIVSTHRLIRVEKNGSLIFGNSYDSNGRVIAQEVEDATGRLYTKTTFDYMKNISATDLVSELYVRNAGHNDTKYIFYNNWVTKEKGRFDHSIRKYWNLGTNAQGTAIYWDMDKNKMKPVPESGYQAPFGSLYRVIDKRGLIKTFYYDTHGNRVAEQVRGDDLSGLANGNQQLFGTKYSYDDLNRCTEIIHSTEKRTVFSYQGEERIPRKIINYVGDQQISFIDRSYNSNGLLVEEIRGGDRPIVREALEYDNKGFLAKKTTYANADTNAPVLRTEQYTHNALGLLVDYMADGECKRHYEYDLMGRCVRETKYTHDGKIVDEVSSYYDSRGYLQGRQDQTSYTLFEYDRTGRCILKAHPYDNQGVDWTNGAPVSDKIEKRAKEKLFFPLAMQFFDYDKVGNLTKSSDECGGVTERQYDALGQVKKIVVYDRNDPTKILAETSFEYEPGGLPSVVTKPDGRIVRYLYTTNGLLKEKISPNKQKKWVYDPSGRIVQEFSDKGGTWTYTEHYSKGLRIVEKKHVETGVKEAYSYDFRGLLVRFTDCRGNSLMKTYDALGRLLTEGVTTYAYTVEDGHPITRISNAIGEVHEIAYYTSGRLRSERWLDSKQACHYGYAVDYDFDLKNHLKFEHWFYGNQFTATKVYGPQGGLLATFAGNFKDATRRLESYHYNRAGECIWSSKRGVTTAYTYDTLHRKTSEANLSAPGKEITTVRDKSTVTQTFSGRLQELTKSLPRGTRTTTQTIGEKPEVVQDREQRNMNPWIISETDANGVDRIINLDRLGRIQSIVADAPGGEKSESVNYMYDERGLVTEIQSNSGISNTKIVRSYNESGNLTGEEVYLDGNLHSKCSQSWDPAGRRDQLAIENGPVYRFGYGPDNFLMSASINAGREENAVHYNYTSAGMMSCKSDKYALTEYEYNDAMQLSGKKIRDAARNELFSFQCTYDTNGGAGKLTKILSSFPTAKGGMNLLEEFAYKHDHLSKERRSCQQGPSATNCDERGYEYLDGTDLMGHFDESLVDKQPQKTPWTATTWAKGIQIKEAHSPDGSCEWVFDYDAMGRVICKTEIGHAPEGVKTTCYTWSPLGNLEKVEETSLNDGSGWTWTARYDGLGRRLKTQFQRKSTPAETIEVYYCYDPEILFLDLGRSYVACGSNVSSSSQANNRWTNSIWKFYGADLCGRYASNQGWGTLEGVFCQGQYSAAVLNAMGNIAAVYDSTGSIGTALKNAGIIPAVLNTGCLAAVYENTRKIAAVYDEAGRGINFKPIVDARPAGQWAFYDRAVTADTKCSFDDFTRSLLWKGVSEDPTGLIWLGARYYDPLFHRFITSDPLGHRGTVDLYSYAGGDPVNYWDPTGMFFSEAWGHVRERWRDPATLGARTQIRHGMAEMGIGAGVVAGSVYLEAQTALLSTPASVPAFMAGAGMMGVGFDDILAGTRSFITGRPQQSIVEYASNAVGVPSFVGKAVVVTAPVILPAVGVAASSIGTTMGMMAAPIVSRVAPWLNKGIDYLNYAASKIFFPNPTMQKIMTGIELGTAGLIGAEYGMAAAKGGWQGVSQQFKEDTALSLSFSGGNSMLATMAIPPLFAARTTVNLGKTLYPSAGKAASAAIDTALGFEPTIPGSQSKWNWLLDKGEYFPKIPAGPITAEKVDKARENLQKAFKRGEHLQQQIKEAMDTLDRPLIGYCEVPPMIEDILRNPSIPQRGVIKPLEDAMKSLHYQIHHPVLQKGFQQKAIYPFLERAQFDIQSWPLNKTFLPRVDGIDPFRTIHNGSHWRTYTKPIEQQIGETMKKFDTGVIGQHQALEKVSEVAQRTRDGLERGEILLNKPKVEKIIESVVPTEARASTSSAVAVPPERLFTIGAAAAGTIEVRELDLGLSQGAVMFLPITP